MAFDLKTLALLVAVSALAATPAMAQDVPSCASNLAACASYLNSTATPPETCCGQLRDAVVKQTVCLCNLLNNKELLKSFNIEPEQGFRLAKNCNASVNASTCSKASAAPTSSPGTSTPAGSSKGSSEKDTNAAQKMSWTAINGIICLLLPFLLKVMF